MKLNVKNKIWLGTLFLFLLLLLTGGVSIYYTVKIKSESKNILQDNYETLSYCHTMQQRLINLGANYNQSIKQFDSALSKQEKNITEPGEETTTNNVRILFTKLKSGDTTRQTIRSIEAELQTILALNMNAIQIKNTKAGTTADNALSIIIFLGGMVFLISLTFIINFPSVITNPIHRLTDAI